LKSDVFSFNNKYYMTPRAMPVILII